MKYVSLVSAVLTLLFMLSVPAYATDQTDVPDWALRMLTILRRIP